LINEGVVVSPVQIQHVQWCAKHHKTDHKNQNEVPDIVDSQRDELDVESCRPKEFAPVKNLRPKAERSKASDDSKIALRH